MKGLTFIISGPSGTGKSSVLRRVLNRDDRYFSVSATTRAPRPGERDGVDYHFMDAERFREMIARDEFLEYAEFVNSFYGTPKKYVDEAMAAGKDVILDIEIQGAQQVRARRPETVSIYILPPSWEELERRLVGRGTDAPEVVQKRLARAREELKLAGDYDYFVVNDDRDLAAERINAIIAAEHCRSRGQLDLLNCQ